MVSLQKSEQIFNTLMNGRIINREIIDNDVLVANPLFNEIMDNLEVYKKQYEMSGFNFLHSGDYVYITEDEKNKTDIAMKAQILLLLIGKYLNNNNYSLQKIKHLNVGLTRSDILGVQAMPETIELLNRAGMGDDVFVQIKNILVERHILLEKTSSESFILSAIGEKFFDELQPLYLG
jgi:site-specific DNA-adenine methylase